MTAGYDRVKGKVDLFTANHRITRVEVRRDGQSLGQFALDPNLRGLQTLPVQSPGGDYRIVVKATQPGTNRAWKELAVSELRVIGDTGVERRGPDEPLRVAVGGLDQPLPEDYESTAISDTKVDNRAFRDEREGCAAFIHDTAADRQQLEATARENGLKLGKPSCTPTQERFEFSADPVYRRVLAVREFDGISRDTRLVLQLPRGWVRLPITYRWDDPLDPGCPSIFRPERVEFLRVENGFLVIAVVGPAGIMYSDDGKASPIEARGATWCKESNAALTCREYNPQNMGSLGDFGIGADGALHFQGKGQPQ
jgi:hypothetical protein